MKRLDAYKHTGETRRVRLINSLHRSSWTTGKCVHIRGNVIYVWGYLVLLLLVNGGFLALSPLETEYIPRPSTANSIYAQRRFCDDL